MLRLCLLWTLAAAEASALIAEAKQLAGTDEALAKVAAAVEKEIKEFKHAGPSLGSRSFVAVTEPIKARTETFRLTFRGDRVAMLSVAGDPEGPFYTAEISDEADKLVTSTARCNDTSLVFTPTKSQV